MQSFNYNENKYYYSDTTKKFYDEQFCELPDYEAKIVADFFYKHISIEPIKPSKVVHIKKNTFCGTNAQDIYVKYSKAFGWEERYKYLFSYGHPLYAKNATPERYSVWFLAHSNLTGTKGGTWNNYIFEDRIEETHENLNDGFRDDNSVRIVFAKVNDNYMFLGLFQPKKIEEKNNAQKKKIYIVTYARIKDDYEPIIHK